MNFIKKYPILFVITYLILAFINPAFCFLILGSIFFYLGSRSIFFLNKIKRTGLSCTGRIISYASGSEGHKTPIVEFTPMGGNLITEKPIIYASTDLSKLRSYKKKIDTEVSVLYDPEDPKKFILVNENEFNYFIVILFSLVGLGGIVLSICVFAGYIHLS